MAWLYFVALAIGLGIVGYGGAQSEPILIGIGGLALVVIACAAATREPGRRSLGESETLRQLRELQHSIEQLGEQQALSDDARRVLNRSRERELLQRAIEEDIRAEDWDAALVLVNELAESFGYRADAEAFREKIDEARHETVDRKVREAIADLDQMVAAMRWTDAMAEAGRIGRLYPESHMTEGLRQRVLQARERYKQELERRFLNAAHEGHAEEAMHLIQELDQYLTEAEAEPLKEVARGVIGQARDNLGVRFKLAVQDKQWTVAAELGERIIEEFPNSRMAEEVRSLIDGIRDRAAALR
ncbi:MAG: hypothetical protein AAGB51_12820 [Planctomycetota bacterium]